MNDPVADALLSARYRDAVQLAGSLLANGEQIPARVGLVRAHVALMEPIQAGAAAGPLPDMPEANVGRALAALATGNPGRGRAILVHDQPTAPEILFDLTLAELHRAVGDPGAAVTVAGRAFTGAAAVDPRWPGWAGITLGRSLADAGDEALAESVLSDALTLFEGLLPGSAAVAEVLDALGALSRRRGEPARSILHHRRALELWTGLLGEQAGSTGACRYSLAQALHRTGDFPGALEEMQQAFLVTTRVLGTDHLDTWITRFELGRMEVDTGEVFDGFPRMQAARTEVARRLGTQHPVVRSMDRWL